MLRINCHLNTNRKKFLAIVDEFHMTSHIRYISRVKWSNPGKGVALYLTCQCCSYWKGSLLLALDYSHQVYLIYLLQLTEIYFIYIFALNIYDMLQNRLIFLVGRVSATGLGESGSISCYIISKTFKKYFIHPCLKLSNIRYISRVKWSNPLKGVAPIPSHRCYSYWKGSLLIAYLTFFTFLLPLTEI